MKNFLTGNLTALSIMLFAGFACAEGPPLLLTHSLTGYNKEAASVTLEYTLQVQNQEEIAHGRLSLSLIPPFSDIPKTTVTVQNLGAKGTAAVKVKLATRLVRDRNFFARLPLLWGAAYTDATGNRVEFPVKSGPGGAK